jgi:NAD-dependent SIR2 family protein deacetylase
VPEKDWEPTYVNPKQIATLIKDKNKILVLTGAGMSAGSGIPTFRG